jgi:dTDP-4-dehydrorhamnose 3,5-epimerase
VSAALPRGVIVRDLLPVVDERGSLTEGFRRSWGLPQLGQLNILRSAAGTLRGMHLHVRRDDVILPVEGELLVGLRDARAPHDPGALVPLPAGRLLTVPAGVVHGFLTTRASVVLYGLTREWDGGDELACRWDDPGLALAWPCRDPVVSERDHAGGTWADLVAAWPAAPDVGARRAERR